MTDHDSGAREEAETGGAAAAPAANVVQFPRAWYGSVDELVPIHPEPPLDPPPADSAADAIEFWGGEAGQAEVAEDPEVEGLEGAHAASRSARNRPPDDDFGSGPAGPQDPDARSPLAGSGRRIGPVAPRERWAPQRLTVGFALALLGLLVGITAVAALSSGGRAKHAEGRTVAAGPALTVTQTIPQTTTVVQTVTARREPVRPRRAPLRHRHLKRQRVPRGAIPATERQVTAVPAGHYSPPPSSVPAATSSTGGYRPPSGGATTPRTSGSSKPSCAPSITNGGACSL